MGVREARYAKDWDRQPTIPNDPTSMPGTSWGALAPFMLPSCDRDVHKLRGSAIMSEKKLGAVESVKGGVVASIKGTGDVAKAAIDTVAGTAETALKDTGKVGVGALHSAKKVGLSAEEARPLLAPARSKRPARSDQRQEKLSAMH